MSFSVPVVHGKVHTTFHEVRNWLGNLLERYASECEGLVARYEYFDIHFHVHTCMLALTNERPFYCLYLGCRKPFFLLSRNCE